MLLRENQRDFSTARQRFRAVFFFEKFFSNLHRFFRRFDDMNRRAESLPSANPCHLALPVVYAVEIEFLFHLFERERLSQVSRDPAVFESEGIEAFP